MQLFILLFIDNLARSETAAAQGCSQVSLIFNKIQDTCELPPEMMVDDRGNLKFT